MMMTFFPHPIKFFGCIQAAPSYVTKFSHHSTNAITSAAIYKFFFSSEDHLSLLAMALTDIKKIPQIRFTAVNSYCNCEWGNSYVFQLVQKDIRHSEHSA